MANNVIGVFDSASVADQVISDLTSSGFDSSYIQRYEGGSSELESELQRAGVSATDASEYAASVTQEGALVIVQADDTRTDEAVEIMNRHYTDVQGGDYDTTGESTEYASGYDTQAATTSAADTDEARLAVAEEQLQIGKRAVNRGGVRVRSVVSERPVEEQVTLRDETVHVDRHAVDRPVTDADTNVFNEQTVEFSETDEEAVVAKDTRVVEEVVVNKEVDQRTETVRDTVRRSDVEVEEADTTRSTNLVDDER
jgi:uncharacterized protein (TIGR02271 family)